jgi:hypothetical protein
MTRRPSGTELFVGCIWQVNLYFLWSFLSLIGNVTVLIVPPEKPSTRTRIHVKLPTIQFLDDNLSAE